MISLSLYIYIHIYIYIERERDAYVYIHICMEAQVTSKIVPFSVSVLAVVANKAETPISYVSTCSVGAEVTPM